MVGWDLIEKVSKVIYGEQDGSIETHLMPLNGVSVVVRKQGKKAVEDFSQPDEPLELVFETEIGHKSWEYPSHEDNQRTIVFKLPYYDGTGIEV